MHCPPSLPSSWQTDFELDLQAPFVGRGAFAQVLRTKDRKTGKIWAVKMLNKPAFACRGIEGQIWAEWRALRKCAEDRQGRGRRVAQLAEAVDENDLVYLRLALCACDLQQVLDRRGRLDEAEVRCYAAQLMEGLQDLHSLNILHRDIKPSNLLLDDGNLRITDFGWCCDLSDCERSLAGTFQYMAPEVLKLEPQSQAVDLWSAGATLFQLLTGHHLLPGPVSGLSHIDPQRATAFKVAALLAEIARCCPLGDDSRPQCLSDICWCFLRQLLEPQPRLRLNATTAPAHAFFLRGLSQAPSGAKVPTPPRASPRGPGVDRPQASRSPILRSQSATVSSSVDRPEVTTKAIPDLMSDHVMSEHQLQQLQGPGLQDWVLKMTHLLREIQQKARGLREGFTLQEQGRQMRGPRNTII